MLTPPPFADISANNIFFIDAFPPSHSIIMFHLCCRRLIGFFEIFEEIIVIVIFIVAEEKGFHLLLSLNRPLGNLWRLRRGLWSLKDHIN